MNAPSELRSEYVDVINSGNIITSDQLWSM